MLECMNEPAGNPRQHRRPGLLLQLTDRGEKIVNQPVTFGGQTYFSTTATSTDPNSCAISSSQRLCRPAVLPHDRGRRTSKAEGLPPSPVVGYVAIQTCTDPAATISNVPVHHRRAEHDPRRR